MYCLVLLCDVVLCNVMYLLGPAFLCGVASCTRMWHSATSLLCELPCGAGVLEGAIDFMNAPAPATATAAAGADAAAAESNTARFLQIVTCNAHGATWSVRGDL